MLYTSDKTIDLSAVKIPNVQQQKMRNEKTTKQRTTNKQTNSIYDE